MLICYISAHEAAMKELERIFGEAGGHYDTVCEEVRPPPLPSYHPATRHRVRGGAPPSVTQLSPLHYDTVCEEVRPPPLPSYHPSTTTPCARKCAALRYLVITPPLRHRVRGGAAR